jgi:hypothetical protein
MNLATVLKEHGMNKPNARIVALEAMDDGRISPKAFAEAAISWMTAEDVEAMLKANEMWPGMFDEDEDDEDED